MNLKHHHKRVLQYLMLNNADKDEVALDVGIKSQGKVVVGNQDTVSSRSDKHKTSPQKDGAILLSVVNS